MIFQNKRPLEDRFVIRAINLTLRVLLFGVGRLHEQNIFFYKKQRAMICSLF